MVDPMIRVLIFANLPPFVLGGAENQSARLAEAWVAAGAQVIVAGHRIPSGQHAVGMRTVKTRRLRVSSRGGRLVRAISYFLAIAWVCLSLRRRIDVAYCRGLGDAAVSLAILRSFGVCRFPVMACPINARGAGDVEFLKTIPGWRWIAKKLDREIGAINLINSLVQDELVSVGITSPRISRIPNGIALSAPVYRTRAACRRMVWSGRLESQKGLDLLLQALSRLPANLPPWRLGVYGDGPLREELEKQSVALGLSAQVSFHGAVPASDVRGILGNADIFVLPSRYEGMSNAAIEAMEAGLPVLCTRCGGIDEFVGSEAGWVCEPSSADALLAMLSHALAESESSWAAKGRRAREIVENSMTIEVVARDNLQVLRCLAREWSRK